MKKPLTTGIAVIAAAATGAMLAWPFAEARWPRLTHRHLTVPSKTPWQFTVLHLSDLHLWKGERWLVDYVRSLADLKPDLVVLTGDNFSEAAGLPEIQKALAPLTSKPGLFVYGSNDYYSGKWKSPLNYFRKFGTGKRKLRDKPDLPTDKLTRWLLESGWIDLNNSHTTMTVSTSDGHEITLAAGGVDDPHINRDRELSFSSMWAQSDLRLGLTHAPYSRTLNSFWAAGTHLILSGHTHGGQICLPGSMAIVNNTDLPLWYSSGVFRWQPGLQESVKPREYKGETYPLPNLKEITSTAFPHAAVSETGKAEDFLAALAERYYVPRAPKSGTPYSWVNVSKGLGTSKFTPLRLFCRPEAVLLTVTGTGEI